MIYAITKDKIFYNLYIHFLTQTLLLLFELEIANTKTLLEEFVFIQMKSINSLCF